MMSVRSALVVAATVSSIGAVLTGCGSDSETATVNASTAHGSLVDNPPLRIASLDAVTLAADLGSSATGAALLLLAGTPSCGVDFYDLKFRTVGAANELTESSGALMLPTGTSAACSGARPIVLYAHGTNTNKALNIADITNASNTEGALIAAMFAAHGYIVVAPNYAGYDISTLGYHPFLDAAQQSGEMLDILTAARSALPISLTPGITDGGKLLVTGYSEGGHVAMATLRALEASGANVTAAAPMSGPYALEAFGDAIFFGHVDIDSTIFAPLLTTSYQHAYGNIYTATSDVYSSSYATGIDTLLPSTTPITTIIGNGLLPESALFDASTPVVSITGNPAESQLLTAALAVPPVPPAGDALFDAGFGSPYLINNNYRVSYVEDAASNPDGAIPVNPSVAPTASLAAAPPTQTLRLAFYKNDLRNGNWEPTVPTLLCGGSQDPTVFFSVNTGTMAAYWPSLVTAGVVTVLDIDPQPPASPSGPFAAIQAAFQATEPDASSNVANYHSDVAPFCTLAARSFFDQVLGG